MDMAESMNPSSPMGRPWRCTGTAMAPNLLLMCKLLLGLILAHGFPATLGDPFLPFLAILDGFHAYPGVFAGVMKGLFLTGAILLVFNVRVREAAMTVGLVVILSLIASKPQFRNHVFIVGCLFLLAGLHRDREDPWLLRLQFALIYGGAFINKVLQADWWNGQFMHYWLHRSMRNPLYEMLFPLLPDLGVAKVISWSVIAVELVLAVLFFLPRFTNLAVGVALAMHLGFLAIVGRRVFGHFTEDVLIAMLVFLRWPEGARRIALGDRLHRVLRPVLPWLDLDRQWVVNPAPPGRWLEVAGEAKPCHDWAALWPLLKYNSTFYVTLFLGFHAVALALARM